MLRELQSFNRMLGKEAVGAKAAENKTSIVVKILEAFQNLSYRCR